jgi:NodT family efflux transporter outer membrane factor (OMF) lipoprotein
MKRILLSGSLAILLSGCASNVLTHEDAIKSVKNGKTVKHLPKSYRGSLNKTKVQDGWIRTFHDQKLNALVKEAQINNPSLKVSAAKVERAVALINLAESELKPSVGASAYYHDNNAEGSREISFGGLSVSWEPDVWGRVGNIVSAQEELTAAQKADYNFARQSLAANTAKAWFILNANAKIYEFSKEIVVLQKKGLKILDAREKIGQGNKRDVHISKALVAEAQEATRTALTAKERSQRALEVLVGRYPSGKLQARSLYRVPSRIPNGLPAQLLERRPDLIAARQRVAAAFHQEASAKLLHLPSVNLKLGLGPNSINDAITNLAAGIFAPLYTGGAIEAQVAVATAEQKAAIAAYAQTALRAFQEVENALASEKHLTTRLKYVSTMVKEYKTAYDMTVERYRIGDSSVLDVIIVQGKWVAAEIKKMQVLRQRLINRVNLHLALGGSFDRTKH